MINFHYKKERNKKKCRDSQADSELVVTVSSGAWSSAVNSFLTGLLCTVYDMFRHLHSACRPIIFSFPISTKPVFSSHTFYPSCFNAIEFDGS